MKSKENLTKNEPKNQRIIIPQKTKSGNDIKTNSNIQNNSKQYDVQLIILEDIKKMKINLEITEKNRYKTIYFTTVSLYDLISLNPFFKKFNDHSKAFDYLLKNFTKIDPSKITYMNNNKEIKIILLFSINDIDEINDDDDIIEESIEVILYHYNSNINNTNKNMGNVTYVINGMKTSLEKLNASIKELKTNVINDKIEKDKKIKELENIINLKKNDIKNNQTVKISKTYGGSEEELNDFDEKFIEIYSKMENFNEDIIALKQDIEDGNLKQKDEMNKNYKMIIEKENELSGLISEKFEDFINRINNLDEKNIEIENNFTNQLTELDMKTNICFNELIKKINGKNNSGNISENDLKIKMNEIIGKIMEDYGNLEQKLENKMNKKIEDLKKEFNDQLNNKIKIFEEKLAGYEKSKEKTINNNNNMNYNQINNKINELEIKILNFESMNFNDKNSINDFKNSITQKINDFEKYKKNLTDNYSKNETNIGKNKTKIDELNNQMAELYEEFYKTQNKSEENKDNTSTYKNEINNIKNELQTIYNEIDNNINQKIKELSENNNKINDNFQKIETKLSTIESKVKLTKAIQLNDNIDNYDNKNSINIEEFKKEIYTKIDNINENIKDNTQDINNKILNMRADSLKIFDSKNDINEQQLKTINEKIIDVEKKISQLTTDKTNDIKNDNNDNNITSNNGNNENKDENENKIKEIEEDFKSYDIRIMNIENKIKQIESNKNIKKINDSLSIKTITSSNSNGYFYQKVKTPLYKSTIPRTPSSSKSNDNSDIKNKKFANYYLSSNSCSLRKRDKRNIFDLKIDTTILKKEDLSEDFFLFKKLKEIYPYNKYIKLILMYSAKRDGDLSKDFHSQCDFIGPNLTLVKTKKGYVFGGFTTKNWKHLYKDINKDDPDISTEQTDEKAFCFSLNKKKIYENRYPDESIIYCNNNYGICFKDFFYIFDECFSNGGICGKNEDDNFEGLDKQYEYNGGQSSFSIEEIEVFQIGFK